PVARIAFAPSGGRTRRSGLPARTARSRAPAAPDRLARPRCAPQPWRQRRRSAAVGGGARALGVFPSIQFAGPTQLGAASDYFTSSAGSLPEESAMDRQPNLILVRLARARTHRSPRI